MRGILRIALAAAAAFGLVNARLALTGPPPDTKTTLPPETRTSPPPATRTLRRPETKTFVGEMGEKGKEKGDRDTWEFKEGRFHSAACDKYGFDAAPYLVQRAGGKLIFTAETRSKKEGVMTWRLTLDGDTLTGAAIWKKGDNAPKEYWVKGTLRK